MTAHRYAPKLTVSQALEQSSQNLSRIFGNRGTACVGCYLEALCTLQDVAKVYGFPLDEFLDDLDRATGRDQRPAAGAKHA
jgi:hypothetical protein